MGDTADDTAGRTRLAIAEAYNEHHASLHRVAYAILYDSGLKEDAADVVNTAILELLEDLPTDVQNWEAYLVRIVQRRALDVVRSAAVRHRAGGDLDLNVRADEIDRIEEAGENIDIMSQMERAVDALNRLDPSTQKVAREYFWFHKTQGEIAASLGITQARVSQIIAAARAQLKDLMEGGQR